MGKGTLLVLAWLAIGAIAAGQRGDFDANTIGCSQGATIAVTMVAGPLNYVGVDAKIACSAPHPSS
jgi:outer membrane lipoprotein SlyB